MINNFRSAIGGSVEDLSYLLYDLIPEDAEGKLMRWLRENAGNVVDKNTAGQIGNRATEQFGFAKEDTGEIGDMLIDLADESAAALGYSLLGPKAESYLHSLGNGLGEYRNLRESGIERSDALSKAAWDTGITFAGEKFVDYGVGKLWNNLFGKNNLTNAVLQENNNVYHNAEDILEYEKYKKILGGNAPKTFEEYNNLKYNSDDWTAFETYADSINRGELSALADFELYKKTSKDIDDAFLGQTANGGIVINSKSNHFINRIVGSIAEKRSGVEISDIKKALQTEPIRTEQADSINYKLDGVCRVSVNPKTGKLIQVNPLPTKRRKNENKR